MFRSLALNSGNRHVGFGLGSFGGSEDNTEELAHLSIHDTQLQLAGHSPTDPHVPFLSVDTDDSAISCELQSALNGDAQLGGGGGGATGGRGMSSSLEVRSDRESPGSPATLRSSTPTHALPRPSTPRSAGNPPSKIIEGCFLPVVYQPPPSAATHYDVGGGKTEPAKTEVTSHLSVNNNNNISIHSNGNSASHSRRDSAISVDPPGGEGGGFEEGEFLAFPPDSEGTKAFDAAVFDLLKVSAEQLAIQITLMDIPVFKAIGPEELTSCKCQGLGRVVGPYATLCYLIYYCSLPSHFDSRFNLRCLDSERQRKTCSKHRSLHSSFQPYQFLGSKRDSFPGEHQSSQ